MAAKRQLGPDPVVPRCERNERSSQRETKNSPIAVLKPLLIATETGRAIKYVIDRGHGPVRSGTIFVISFEGMKHRFLTCSRDLEYTAPAAARRTVERSLHRYNPCVWSYTGVPRVLKPIDRKSVV